MKITAVRCFQLSGRADLQSNEERQSQMLDIYPEFAARGVTARTANSVHKGTYVEIDTDDAADALAIAICHAHHRQSAVGRLVLAS